MSGPSVAEERGQDSAEAPADAAHRYLADDAVKRDPYRLLAELRKAGPIVQTTGGPWLVLELETAKSVLSDPRFSRSRAAADTLGSFLDPGPAAEIWTTKLVSSDGDTHRRL